MSVFDDMGDWGYCRFCDRLVLLEESGELTAHGTALSSQSCAGSGEEPTQPPEEREEYGPQPFGPRSEDG